MRLMLLLLFAASPRPAIAAGIQGTVRDETGRVCPNLFIDLVGSYYGIKTDSHGHYEFAEEVPLGTYTLHAKGALPSMDRRVNLPARETFTIDLLTCRSADDPFVASYLRGQPEELYVRRNAEKPSGEQIVDAAETDLMLAKNYPYDARKGEEHDGCRATIMAAKTQYAVGEEVRVIHIFDATEPGQQVYVMGPKAIYDEYVDGILATTRLADRHVWFYAGMVCGSPKADFNYEITTYKFSKPGIHKVEWRGTGFNEGKPITSNN